MPYEEGLIRVQLGTYRKGNLYEHNEHFKRAIQIFEKMGAIHELQAAKRAQAGETRF